MEEIYPGWPNHPKGVVPEFKDAWFEDHELYPEIEDLIIRWNNDGTKTAGVLARRICQLLNSKK